MAFGENKKKFIPAFLLDFMEDDPIFESTCHGESFQSIQKEMVRKNKRER